MKWSDKITVTNEDNMQLMARYPDKYFDLAIVDPPYGIGMDEQKESYNKGKKGEGKRHRKQWCKKGWDDEIPNLKYFNELFRVSKSQIIWGGNYMTEFLKPSKCWIIWDKIQEFTGSDFEMAWTSFNKSNKAFRMTRIEAYSNNNKINKDCGVKIHPTQKPVALYKWLLDKYTKPTDKILDTHLGSGSIAIACHDYGFELTACELDTEYYEAAKKRFLNHSAQTKLFMP